MSDESAIPWLEELKLHGAAKNFSEFCKTEIIRRNNTVEGFNRDTHDEAIKMVLRKLGALDTEKLL